MYFLRCLWVNFFLILSIFSTIYSSFSFLSIAIPPSILRLDVMFSLEICRWHNIALLPSALCDKFELNSFFEVSPIPQHTVYYFYPGALSNALGGVSIFLLVYQAIWVESYAKTHHKLAMDDTHAQLIY